MTEGGVKWHQSLRMRAVPACFFPHVCPRSQRQSVYVSLILGGHKIYHTLPSVLIACLR